MPLDPEPPELPSLPVSEAIATVALAAHAAESPAPGRPIHTHCENCGTKLDGPWCHQCGQHDFEFHRSFWHVFHDALENFFHFDAKLFRNIVTLLFRPGRLTADFNAGKRAPQMPPFRLYLFVSILFFFLVFIDTKPEEGIRLGVPENSGVNLTKNGEPLALAEALAEVKKDPTGNPGRRRAVDEIREAAERVRDARLAEKAARRKAGSKPDDGTGAEFMRFMEEQGRRARDPVQQRAMVQTFLHSLPKMLLVCLPFFALYTRFLFRKSGQVYLQHLIVALHFHTFIFLWVMARNGWVFLADLAGFGLKGWLSLACNLWLVLYPFFMLRRLYANSWFWTIFKTGVLGLGYVLTLGVALVITGFIILVLL